MLWSRSFILLLLVSGVSYAQPEESSIPDPLSLEQAIKLVDEAHPDLARVKLNIEQSDIDLLDAENLNAAKVIADARLRWVDHEDPPPQIDQHDDNRLRLTLTKRLYDSGYSSSLSDAARLGGQAATLRYDEVRDLHVIKVMRNFFEVIIADLESSRDLEAMSVAFVRMDRAQDHHELGRISDIDLLEFQSRYQDTRKKLYASEGEARRSRIALAMSLNRPGQQPSKLTPPALKLGKIDLLPYEELLEQVMSGNRVVQSKNVQLQAAHAKVEAARSKYKPNITSEVQRAEHSRLTGSSDKWRVGVELSVPLYDGGRSDAAIRRAQLEVTRAKLDLRYLQMKLGEQVQELWERVRVLQAEGDASTAFSDFRDLYLDRSRTLYELEVKTDLGDSMVEISQALVRSAEQQFQLALTLAELNALAGKSLTDWKALTVKKPSG